MNYITLVRVITRHSPDSGRLALVGNGEGIHALAGALDLAVVSKLYGSTVEEKIGDIGTYEYTSGTNNGHYYFQSVTGERFEWHYRSGWLGAMPRLASFGL